MGRRTPSPAMALAGVALIVALGGTAIAGGVLTKKKVNKIITNRAPGLSVSHARTADNATNATNATSVGGVSIQPLSLAVPNPTGTGTTLLSVGGSEVDLGSCSNQVDIDIRRGALGPPITGQLIENAALPNVLHPDPGAGGGEANNSAIGVTATIRESSGRVTRLTADAFPGANDCFVQGTIERFG